MPSLSVHSNSTVVPLPAAGKDSSNVSFVSPSPESTPVWVFFTFVAAVDLEAATVDK